MRTLVPALAAAAVVLCAAQAHAQQGFTFAGLPWNSDAAATVRRMEAAGYRLVSNDSSAPDAHYRSFVHGRTGDTVLVGFASGRARRVTLLGRVLPEPRAAEAFRARRAALAARHGPGEAGVVPRSWMWNARDRSWLLLTSEQGRVRDVYFRPRGESSVVPPGPRIIQSTPQRGTAWHAGRVSAATWRPVHAADTLVVSWDSADARNVVRRLVTARVRWDWRDARQAGGHPSYDALELYVVLDCDFRERHDRGIYFYRGNAMVYRVPLSDVGIRWQQGPAGPEWDRVVRTLCRLVDPAR